MAKGKTKQQWAKETANKTFRKNVRSNGNDLMIVLMGLGFAIILGISFLLLIWS